MRRFIVCAENPAFVESIARILHELYDTCTVEYMYGPEALEASLRSDSGGADVLLTDVELRTKNSIDIIRKYLKPSSPLRIIYITEKIEYCTKVYDTPHSGFLLKPVERKELKKTTDRALRELEQHKKVGIEVKCGSNTYVISAPSLLYIESYGRTLLLTTDEEQLESYEKLTDFSGKLDRRFLICHKSFLINMDRVKQFLGDRFLMENDVWIPVSQSKRRVVREQFHQYLSQS